MNTTYNESLSAASGKESWKRGDTAKRVYDFETREQSVSQRDFAKNNNVPRSSLRYWVARKNNIDA
ncbi:hypothetical protein DSCO28_71450 [Desulfosarcina ovata subsp. sediminis]|uniref:HTH psq-type domain-containing protein n=2 Tax=Desulfosarcina ovata TaxID=83564 RepID=A0A5K8AL51_9BACT|nr:hypothetical protein DSCO28_71450 [Desulfosarcina ovata subsp. sediminis]BBO93435.1 hypothetical protein DSCOOX_66150 [Desulfosarcina ovata subsp. ovata]